VQFSASVTNMATGASARQPRFDVLFEPVQIGPVCARDRFVEVPRCNGMGYRELQDRRSEWDAAGLQTVTAVGDCWCPGTIAAAVWGATGTPTSFGEPPHHGDTVPFLREVTKLADARIRRGADGIG
jgi:hypothetical protein